MIGLAIFGGILFLLCCRIQDEIQTHTQRTPSSPRWLLGQSHHRWVIPGYPGYPGYEHRVIPGYSELFRVINRLSRLSRLYGVMSAGLYRVIAELYRVIPGYAVLYSYGLWALGYNPTGYWEITRRS